MTKKDSEDCICGHRPHQGRVCETPTDEFEPFGTGKRRKYCSCPGTEATVPREAPAACSRCGHTPHPGNACLASLGGFEPIGTGKSRGMRTKWCDCKMPPTSQKDESKR